MKKIGDSQSNSIYTKTVAAVKRERVTSLNRKNILNQNHKEKYFL